METGCAAPASNSWRAKAAILVFWLDRPQERVLFVEIWAFAANFGWLPGGCSMAIANHSGATLAVAELDSSAAQESGALHAGWAGHGSPVCFNKGPAA